MVGEADEEAAVEEQEAELDGPDGGPEAEDGDELKEDVSRDLGLEELGRQDGLPSGDAAYVVEGIGHPSEKCSADQEQGPTQQMQRIIPEPFPQPYTSNVKTKRREARGDPEAHPYDRL